MLILGVQETIPGVTRFMKYLFLADKSKTFGKTLRGVDWTPHYYGPYWKGFNDATESLAQRGFLKTEKLQSQSGYTLTQFSITTKGRQRFRTLAASQDTSNLVYLLREHQKQPLASLLSFVCEQYPEYTGKSVIKDQVLG